MRLPSVAPDVFEEFSAPVSSHHPIPFLLEASAHSAAGCGSQWLQSN